MEIIPKNCKSHPHCPHGPCLMFERYSSNGNKTCRKFYACSACRNRSECSFFQWADEKVSEKWTQHWKLQIEKEKSQFSRQDYQKRLASFKKLSPHQQKYCRTCSMLLLSNEVGNHNDHNIYSNVNKELKQPSCLFHPLQNSKTEAQYFFTPETTTFLVQLVKSLGYSKLVLIGVPKVHEYIISEKIGLETFLMDIDKRYMQFFDESQFCHYNMFNNYFFDPESEKKFEHFLIERNGNKVIFILDPPFGGLVDAITYTLQELSTVWRKVNSLPDTMELPLMWIFPYFNETRIVDSMPHLKMMDYKVSYSNHKKFSGKSKTQDSPVRIFTNIESHLFAISDEKNYRFCSICKRYVSIENQHCPKCQACTTKHGRTYKHCSLCERCVKSSFEHCETCKKCVLAKHNCDAVLKPPTCFICSSIGHKKRDCPQNDIYQKNPKRKRKSR